MTKPFDPVATMVAYHAALEARDMVFLASVFASDAEYHSKGLGPVSGKSAILASIESYFAKYPDHKAWDTTVKQDSALVASCEWQLRATDPKTSVAFSRHGNERVTFNAGGLIVSVDVEDLG
jgi:SnoaL-like domain